MTVVKRGWWVGILVGLLGLLGWIWMIAIVVFWAIFLVQIWRPRARRRNGTVTIVDRQRVTLTGTVRPTGALLVAPLSGKPCVAYEARALMGELLGEVVERRMISFELETGAGVLIVDGIEADLVVPRDPLIPRQLDRETAFLVAHVGGALDLESTSFEERRIEAGREVAIQGVIVVGSTPARMRIVGPAPDWLVIGPPR